MLEKGNIDLLLSKPVSRTQLLIGKFSGGILVVLINIAFLVVGIWLVISLRFGSFNFSFLTIIISVTFIFAVLYSLIVLFGVITQSSILGMMSAYFIFLVLSPLLYNAQTKFSEFITSDFLNGIISFFYYLLPKTSELMGVSIDIAAGNSVKEWQPVYTSFAFMTAVIVYAVFIFRKKDF
jgi:ABC-type transport system involved in multi-copper enzyme maturation permease subunit